MTHRENLAVVRRFLDGTHSNALEVIDETVAPGIVTHGFPGGRNPDSRETYKQFFRDFGAAFSDMRFELGALVADSELVAARFIVEVTHSGPFAGQPPTGRRISFGGMALYRLADGQIAETWLQLDELALLTQAGVLAA